MMKLMKEDKSLNTFVDFNSEVVPVLLSYRVKSDKPCGHRNRQRLLIDVIIITHAGEHLHRRERKKERKNHNDIHNHPGKCS